MMDPCCVVCVEQLTIHEKVKNLTRNSIIAQRFPRHATKLASGMALGIAVGTALGTAVSTAVG